MRILMVSSGFPPKVNTGAEKFCYELSKNLIQRGLEVEVATDTNLNEYEGIKLHKLFKVQNKYARKIFFDYYNPMNILIIRKIIKKVKPDIIHFHNIYGISTQLINYTSKRYPTVTTVHDYWPFCFNSTMLNKDKICNMNCNICRFPLGFITKKIKMYHLRSTYLVAPSNFMKNKLVSAGYKNIETIYNGIDLPKKETDYTTNRIVYIGRVSYEKGILFFLETVKNNIDTKIDIIGKGPLLSHLRNKYSKCKNICFKGFVENIHEEFVQGGIVVVPSIYHENLPYVILEAMSYGIPVIGSNIGGIPELIEHKKTGLLFAPRDRDDLEKQVNYLIKNPEKIKRMGKNAANKVKKKFNWNRTTKSYLELYQKLLKK